MLEITRKAYLGERKECWDGLESETNALADFMKKSIENLFNSNADIMKIKYEKSCGAVIFRKFINEYKILMLNFQFGELNFWGFPKGHMENDETEIQTAVREIKEETGLEVKIIPKFRETTSFSPSHKNVVVEVIYFAANSNEIETVPEEDEKELVVDSKWCSFDEAKDLITFGCNKEILEKFIKFFDQYKTKRHTEASKLFENILKFSDEKTAEDIAHSIELPPCASKKKCANWVNRISSKLEETFDEATIKKIRQGCYCRDGGKLDENKKWLKEIYSDSRDIPEFVEKVNNYVKEMANQDAGWYIQDGHLFTKYLDCSCPMLEEIDILPTKIWCQCTARFCKEVFDSVFDFEVDVKIIKSIKMGHDCCLIKVSKENGSPLIGGGL